MGTVSKGIACKICRNNVEGICNVGNTSPVNRKDECWTFAYKGAHPGLAEPAERSNDW